MTGFLSSVEVVELIVQVRARTPNAIKSHICAKLVRQQTHRMTVNLPAVSGHVSTMIPSRSSSFGPSFYFDYGYMYAYIYRCIFIERERL